MRAARKLGGRRLGFAGTGGAGGAMRANAFGRPSPSSPPPAPGTPGAPPLGPFYELETSSPALALAPGESAEHVHRTLHFLGAQEYATRK